MAPVFTDELRGLIENKGEIGLLGQLDKLQIVDRCRCSDRSCASFYTAPSPSHAWGEGHRNVLLESRKGLLVLDVVGDKVVMIEVSGRPEVRKALGLLMPL